MKHDIVLAFDSFAGDQSVTVRATVRDYPGEPGSLSVPATRSITSLYLYDNDYSSPLYGSPVVGLDPAAEIELLREAERRAGIIC